MNKVIAFMLGATAGTLITWKLLEQKYKQIADEEIEAVREYYKRKQEIDEFIKTNDNVSYSSKDDSNENEVKEIEEVKVEEYDEIVSELGYTDDNDTIFIDQDEDMIAPYVISPEEYGEFVGWDAKSWVYYTDGIVADDYEIVVDPESMIGDGLEHFGDYEDDCVYVRNENLECDFEILKHDITFDELLSRRVNKDDC